MPDGNTEQVIFAHGGQQYSVTIPAGLSDAEAHQWAMANKPKFAALNLPSPAQKQAHAGDVARAKQTIQPGKPSIEDPKAAALRDFSARNPNEKLKEHFKESAVVTGGMVGGELVAPLATGAGEVAGASRILKWLLPAITRASGAGVGSGGAALITGSSPKEALATGSKVAATELGTEAAIAGGLKVAKGAKRLVKDLSKSKVTELQEAHVADTAKIEKQYLEDLEAHKKQVRELKAEHQQATREFKSAEEMKQHQQSLATTVRDNIQLADKRIAQKLGDEFNAVNDAVESKAPRVKVEDVEKTARAELFFPDSVQAFNNIMDNFRSKLGMSDYGILRKTYTRMNELLYGGKELPADLYSAVKTVRDSLGKDLQKAATSVGEGQRFSRTMKKWSEYQSDWHDTSSLAKGGSPLSRILKAEDPQFVIDQLSGKSAERLLTDLKKYGSYGADSGLAQRLQQFTKRLKATPTPKAPEQPHIPAEPKRPDIQPFDREAAARKILVDRIRKGLITVGAGTAGAVGGELLYKALFGGGTGRSGGAVP